MRRIAGIAFAIAAVVAAFACGGGSPTGPSGSGGNFNLRITDNPYGSATAVLITFSDVTVQTSSGDSKKVSLANGASSLTCDLKKLENSATDLLGTANLKAGDDFTMVRFKVDKARIFFDNPATSPTPCASSIPEPQGAAFTMTVPSNEVKITDRPFTMADGGTTVLLDFDGPGSIVETGSNKYILTPVVRTKSVE